MPIPVTTDLYSPCNPVTTTSPCNKLYRDIGYTQLALPGVYVWLDKLYFVDNTGKVYDIIPCPGPCGFNGPDCTVKNNIQCNVIQNNKNICTNFKAGCCACLGLGPCVP